MLTLASGAAIALSQGELMVCRARAGATAPDLGTPVDTESGLSGACVRSGKVLVCADTETDPRVNLDVCRYLGIRSIAVLPIILEGELAGLFEAFAQQPGAFSANEVAALQSMCDLVISVIRSRPKAETAPQAEVVAALSARAAGQPLEAWLSASLQEPADDLMCEIEQRKLPQPQSEPAVRNLELVKGGRNGEPAATATASPVFQNPDPEDDLVCEQAMRPAFEPMPLPGGAERAHAFRAFTPAHDLPKEHTISRKLLATGIVVVIAGLMWLGWCNHAHGVAGAAVEKEILEQTSAPAALSGLDEDTSDSDALRQLRALAQAGDANAEVALAVRYANGDGVPQSYPEALKWFRVAQEGGVTVLWGPAAQAWQRVERWAKSSQE